MAGELQIRIFDVEHGACAMLLAPNSGRLVMVDSGHNDSLGWRPSAYIRQVLNRTVLDYLFITNADQDHLSDLNGLWEQQVSVTTLFRNRTPDPDTLRAIKQDACGLFGKLTDDIERYLQIHRSYNSPATEPFDVHMGGVTCQVFCNEYPRFDDTNNLSLVAFFHFGGFTICFPGDLEDAGWLALLERPAFCAALARTTVLVASHHGRMSGFCPEVFDHCEPSVIVVSDKPIEHETQDLDYGPFVKENGVWVLNQGKRRHVLTTRRDGDIIFVVSPDGTFTVTTERHTSKQPA
jgi:beta-lactamase superfamily II metal-dependent hydrolase